MKSGRRVSLKGKLLLASSDLIDPHFLRTVILIVQHGKKGALGLVLNRPLPLTVNEACEGALDGPLVRSPIYQGGPCEGPLMVIHTLEPAADATVLPGVFFSTNRDMVEQVLGHEEPGMHTRFFAGYSGWTPGQLERELKEGSWLVCDDAMAGGMVLGAGSLTPADDGPSTVPLGAGIAAVVFNPADPYTRLKSRIDLAGWVRADLIPDDPSVN